MRQFRQRGGEGFKKGFGKPAYKLGKGSNKKILGSDRSSGLDNKLITEDLEQTFAETSTIYVLTLFMVVAWLYIYIYIILINNSYCHFINMTVN